MNKKYVELNSLTEGIDGYIGITIERNAEFKGLPEIKNIHVSVGRTAFSKDYPRDLGSYENLEELSADIKRGRIKRSFIEHAKNNWEGWGRTDQGGA